MKSHHAFHSVPGGPQSATEAETERFHKPGLLGNGKRVSFRSLVEFPFNLFIFLDREPHVALIARRLNKKLAKQVSQKRSKGCPRGSKSLQKSILNTSKMGLGAPWGAGPHFGTNLARSLASILPPKWPQGTPKWPWMKPNGVKGRQMSFKNQCENHHSFSYPFLYEELAKRASKYVENLSNFYPKTDVKQNWRRKVRYAIRPRKHIWFITFF